MPIHPARRMQHLLDEVLGGLGGSPPLVGPRSPAPLAPPSRFPSRPFGVRSLPRAHATPLSNTRLRLHQKCTPPAGMRGQPRGPRPGRRAGSENAHPARETCAPPHANRGTTLSTEKYVQRRLSDQGHSQVTTPALSPIRRNRASFPAFPSRNLFCMEQPS
jgi:hypothetical protein